VTPPWTSAFDEDAHEDDGSGEKKSARRGIGIVERLRRRRSKETEADVARSASVLDGVANDVDMAITQRRRKLNARLGTSLKMFRQEVLDEVSEQKETVLQRRTRLADRRKDVSLSLDALRSDLNEEIEESLAGVKRGGKTLERALRQMRQTWAGEVAELVREAEAEIDLAVAEVEEAIAAQREELVRSINTFEDLWETPLNASRLNASLQRMPPLFSNAELSNRLVKLQDSLATTSADVEYDLKIFKRRWEATTEKVEALPSELPKLKSLADMRMYVADTIFAGDVPALLTRPRGRRLKLPAAEPLPDPLGLNVDPESSSPVLRPTVASNLRLAGRKITIITTAALPWMTGTSINPLLRAAYLSKAGYDVTLLLPWIPVAQQKDLFPQGLSFDKQSAQEQYVRWWCENRANVEAAQLKLRWFPAVYAPILGAIIQGTDNVIDCIPPEERDVVILEEPEHLNWYHHGPRWTDEFAHVVGIAHTNYQQYARLNTEGVIKSGEIKEGFVNVLNNLVCSAHTDIVVKLSATLPDVPGYNLVCNVHGVRAEFLAIGAAAAERSKGGDTAWPGGAYFLGKAMFTKGYRELIEALVSYRNERRGESGESEGESDVELPLVDTYGSGPEFEQIVAQIEGEALPIDAHPGIDHAHPTIHGYRVFVNPSTSDVLCTATAEALAMGKKVLIPRHPSNIFFEQFSNAIMYDDPMELVPLLREALASEPTPMSPMEQYRLSWDAASERLLDAAALPMGTQRTKEEPTSTLAYYTHYLMGVQPVFDAFRSVTGAPPVQPWSKRLSHWRTFGRLEDDHTHQAADHSAPR